MCHKSRLPELSPSTEYSIEIYTIYHIPTCLIAYMCVPHLIMHVSIKVHPSANQIVPFGHVTVTDQSGSRIGHVTSNPL